MGELQSGGQETTDKGERGITLKEAARTVNAAIEADRDRLQKIAEATGQEPILLEGETYAGYYARLMVDPAMVARTMLDYDYPLYRTLGLQEPRGMWKDLAQMAGLNSAFSVDL